MTHYLKFSCMTQINSSFRLMSTKVREVYGLSMNGSMRVATGSLSERLGVEPGDMYRIVETSEWLAYSLYKVAKIIGREDLLNEIYNLRIRIKYGIKEELMSLIQFRGIGRVKARSLYNAGIKDSTILANTPESKLSAIPKIGIALAEDFEG